MKVYFPGNPYERNKDIVDTSTQKLFSRTGEGEKWTGWLSQPTLYLDSEEYKRLKSTAEFIRNNFDVVLSCGIGGSYLGARAIIEAFYGDYNSSPRRTGPEIYFVGQNTSSEVIRDIVQRCRHKNVCIINISKSGTTLETALAFRTFYYACNPYVITITGSEGVLRKMTEKNKWENFLVPEDIGGRYSVLTAVGLLPIEVAGINTELILKGAGNAMISESIENAKEYAAYRYECGKENKEEFFAVNSPWLTQLLEWHKQLFAESHGKDESGIFPTGGTYPMDLHSVGQYLQQGRPIFFETQLIRKNRPITIPNVKLKDGLEKYSSLDFDEVNECQMNGTKSAHEKAGMPVAQIILDAVNPEKEIGEFLQFDMLACAIEAYMENLNPFNQPGVEEHKNRTKELLESAVAKKGY